MNATLSSFSELNVNDDGDIDDDDFADDNSSMISGTSASTTTNSTLKKRRRRKQPLTLQGQLRRQNQLKADKVTRMANARAAETLNERRERLQEDSERRAERNRIKRHTEEGQDHAIEARRKRRGLENMYKFGRANIDQPLEKVFNQVDVGFMDQVCNHCGAFYSEKEKQLTSGTYMNCCQNGKKLKFKFELYFKCNFE